MIEIEGLYIETDLMEIIEELRSQRARDGIFLFNTIKRGHDNIQFSCPDHKDGQERKPSCGVRTVPGYNGGRVIPAGTVHCFTCGYTASLPEMVSHVFGKRDLGMYGLNWLRNNYAVGEIEKRPPIQLNLRRDLDQEQEVIIPDSVLDLYRYYHDYMWERGLDEEVVEKFDVGYDEASNCLTFPVRNMKGETVFVYRRSVSTKFHHYAEGVDKTNYLYGMYEVEKYFPNATKVAVVESIINCLTLWVNGIPAVSTMGVGGGRQYKLLKNWYIRSYILGFDPDEAGNDATEKFVNQLRGYKLLSRYVYLDGRDINDLKELVTELREEPCV